MLFGYILGVAIISTISALFIKLAVKLVAQKSVDFTKSFVISAISLLGTFFAQDLLNGIRSNSSLIAAVPAFVFFLLCWLLNIWFVKYGDEDDSRNYGKAFLVTVIQCALLVITSLILSFLFISILMAIGSPQSR
jgi:hypothetical protein